MAQVRRRRRDHPFFAAVYDIVVRAADRRYYARRRAEVAGEASGDVLEIGVGTGANLAYYPAGARLVAVEPDRHMRRRARRRAETLGRRVAFVGAAAEALPFADGAFDVVVSTLVLCSVADPVAAAKEMWRVLRPGGVVRMLEHVRADAPGLARWQDLVTPVWMRLGAGCHPNRPTLETLRQVGFEVIRVRHEAFGPAPVRPHVVAVLRKPLIR